jgi:hypothetical protein
MPIIFVHGVASRLHTKAKTHEKTWEFIRLVRKLQSQTVQSFETKL